ncbi:MAG: nucleotidyltransferase domain-containing protein [Chloroflexi bacterium]|nr:nucleotidyltransferase domain-containing protein [Chloroflexota bacterium]
MEKQSRRLRAKRVLPGKRITRRQIAAVARHIAEKFNPEQIILFGSYAYGKPTPDSDVDLLVVMLERMPRWRQVGAIYSSFNPYPFSMDIHVVTPERLQERIGLGDSFIRQITTKGTVLYERASNGMDRARRGRSGHRAARTARAAAAKL